MRESKLIPRKINTVARVFCLVQKWAIDTVLRKTLRIAITIASVDQKYKLPGVAENEIYSTLMVRMYPEDELCVPMRHTGSGTQRKPQKVIGPGHKK